MTHHFTKVLFSKILAIMIERVFGHSEQNKPLKTQ